MYGLTPLDDNLPDAVEFTRQREKEIRQAMNQPERETVDSVDKIIRDRGKRYGDFSDNASVAQELKFVVHRAWMVVGAQLQTNAAALKQIEPVDGGHHVEQVGFLWFSAKGKTAVGTFHGIE